MGIQIIIQPNKKLTVFNNISTTIDMWDATTDEVVDFLVERERTRIKDEVATTVAKLRAGKKPYYQFTLDWSEALQKVREAHGWEVVGKILDTMDRVEPPA